MSGENLKQKKFMI